MKNKIPLSLIFFVGIFSAIGWSFNSFFSKGGILNLSFLEILYAPVLKKNGITKADFFLSRKSAGHWIVSIEKIAFAGGHIHNIRLDWGWNNGRIRLNHVAVKDVTIDLGRLQNNPQSETSILQPIIAIVSQLSGSIINLKISGSKHLYNTFLLPVLKKTMGNTTTDLENIKKVQEKKQIKRVSSNDFSIRSSSNNESLHGSILITESGNLSPKNNAQNSTRTPIFGSELQVNSPIDRAIDWILPALDIYCENGEILIGPSKISDEKAVNNWIPNNPITHTPVPNNNQKISDFSQISELQKTPISNFEKFTIPFKRQVPFEIFHAPCKMPAPFMPLFVSKSWQNFGVDIFSGLYKKLNVSKDLPIGFAHPNFISTFNALNFPMSLCTEKFSVHAVYTCTQLDPLLTLPYNTAIDSTWSYILMHASLWPNVSDIFSTRYFFSALSSCVSMNTLFSIPLYTPLSEYFGSDRKEFSDTVFQPSYSNSFHSSRMPWVRIQIFSTPWGGEATCSWNPLFLNLPVLGLLDFAIKGEARAEWTLKNKVIAQWLLITKVEQVGTAYMPGTLLQPWKNGKSWEIKPLSRSSHNPIFHSKKIASTIYPVDQKPCVIPSNQKAIQAASAIREKCVTERVVNKSTNQVNFSQDKNVDQDFIVGPLADFSSEQSSSLPPLSMQLTTSSGKNLTEGKIPTKGNASGCKLAKTYFYATFSNQHPMHIRIKTVIDQAEISASFDTLDTRSTQEHFWLGEAHIDHGTIDVKKLRHFWPKMTSTLMARHWILDNFHGGAISKATLVLDQSNNTHPHSNNIKSGAHNKSNTRFSGSLDIRQATLSFMPDMPRIEKMDFTSTFDRNGFHIVVTKGEFENHTLQGSVDVKIDSDPVILKLDLSLSGPLEKLFPILWRFSGAPDLGIKNPTGIDTTRIYGSLPLVSTLSPKDLALNLYSTIPHAGLDFPVENHWAYIRKTHVTIDYRNNALQITAKGETNGIPTQWSWRDNALYFSGQPTIQNIQDLLHCKIEPWIKKSLTVQGKYRDGQWDIDLNLTPALCTLPWIHWKKDVGSKLGVNVAFNRKKCHIITKGTDVSGTLNAMLFGKNPKIDADIHLGKTFGRYVYTGNQGGLNWGEFVQKLLKSGHHQLFFRSPNIHLPQLGFSDGISETSKKLESGAVTAAIVPKIYKHSGATRIDMDIACGHVSLKSIAMDQVHLQLSGSSETLWPEKGQFLTHYTWQNGSFYSMHQAKKVKRQKTGHVSILWHAKDKKNTHINADVVDVGSVCNGLGITHRIRGGDLRLNALQDDSGVYNGSIYIDNLKTKISALGKLLSIISPTIFMEMFSSGVTFRQLDADFLYEPGVFKIMNGVAKGINLGLFIKGSIYTQPGRFKLQGVAIPSYLINTFFSKFPIIGWLLGGNKGLISSNFTVTGPLNDPKIKTIPFSLFKIGFLKNIPFFKKSKKSQQSNPKIKKAAPKFVKSNQSIHNLKSNQRSKTF